VDGIEARTQEVLAERILDHVEECLEYKREIIEAVEMAFSIQGDIQE
jgi:hypothetical protein